MRSGGDDESEDAEAPLMSGYIPVDTPPGTAPMPLGSPVPANVGSGRSGRSGGKPVAPPRMSSKGPKPSKRQKLAKRANKRKVSR